MICINKRQVMLPVQLFYVHPKAKDVNNMFFQDDLNPEASDPGASLCFSRESRRSVSSSRAYGNSQETAHDSSSFTYDMTAKLILTYREHGRIHYLVQHTRNPKPIPLERFSSLRINKASKCGLKIGVEPENMSPARNPKPQTPKPETLTRNKRPFLPRYD